MVFDEGLYDPANEPDIAYPHLFSYFKGEEWRTQYLTRKLLKEHFTAKPNGIPGNEDTGTMSGWAVFNMMGFYPDCPGLPEYTLTSPVFDKVTIKLDPKWYKNESLVIEAVRPDSEAIYIDKVQTGNTNHSGFRIEHDKLVNAGKITFYMKDRK